MAHTPIAPTTSLTASDGSTQMIDSIFMTVGDVDNWQIGEVVFIVAAGCIDSVIDVVTEVGRRGYTALYEPLGWCIPAHFGSDPAANRAATLFLRRTWPHNPTEGAPPARQLCWLRSALSRARRQAGSATVVRFVQTRDQRF